MISKTSIRDKKTRHAKLINLGYNKTYHKNLSADKFTWSLVIITKKMKSESHFEVFI